MKGFFLFGALQMICPLCQETLQMTERKGVEIDFCPKCRGVWLDRGELQKIIDLSIADGAKSSPPAVEPRGYAEEYADDRGSYRSDSQRVGSYRYDSHPHRYKKRESWFSELFDWD